MAHPFWDKYLEFEDRSEAHDRIFAILQRVIHIPMHQYARYFEKFRQLAHTRPLTELLTAEEIEKYRQEIISVAGHAPMGDVELEREIRTKIDNEHMIVFTKCQTETTKRWTYESEIKRPYFHVTELDIHQLVNWRKYLDFEEAEGDFVRAQFLYERCLVTCAFYDEFWFRYARWMHAQEEKQEEVRNIYQRASTLYVPISKPGIRLQYAYFEESAGRPDVAQDIHQAILLRLPGHVETVVSWANLQRRQSGLDSAIEVLKSQIDEPLVELHAKAALVVEWANLLWKTKGSISEARLVFKENEKWYPDSLIFWEKYLQFELEQPTTAESEKEQYEKISGVLNDIRQKSKLSTASIKELSHYYLEYLQQRGTKEAMQEFLQVDMEINGPASVRKIRLTEDGKPAPVETEVEGEVRKGEMRFYKYYDLPELVASPQVSKIPSLGSPNAY